jgi:hypothetical protein
MYCDVQMVFFVGKERGSASRCTQSIVVSEFSRGQAETSCPAGTSGNWQGSDMTRQI